MNGSYRLPALFALSLLAAACSADKSVGPDATPANLSQVFSQMTLPAAMGSVTALPSGAAALGAPTPSNCSYTSASQNFVCAPITSNGVTFSQSYWLYDASGNPASAWTSGGVASVRMKTTMAGTIVDASTNISINEQQDMTLSGLLGSTHLLNGTTTMTMNGTALAGSVSVPISTTMNMTVLNLVPPALNAGANSWPASGTITADISTSGTPGFTMQVRMVFNGTSKVDVTTTVNGLVTHCLLDLASPSPTCG